MTKPKFSLKRAHSLAKRMNLDFEQAKAVTDTDKYLDWYFVDICKVLSHETQNCHFQNFASRDMASFAEAPEQIRIIEIDQQWSFFLLNANQLLTVWATTIGSDKEQARQISLYRESLDVFINPYQHETFREKMRPYLLGNEDGTDHIYGQQLKLANLLTAAMFTSLICQELAHHELDHLQEQESTKIELEADALGYLYFCRIIDAFGQLPILKVPPTMHGAPLLLLEFIKSLEVIGLLKPTSTHPPADTRINNLKMLFNRHASRDSKDLYAGFQANISEMNELLT